MPCNSDYLAPSGQELESRRVCGFILYINRELKRPTAQWIQEADQEYYGNVRRLDEATKILCEMYRSLTSKDRERIIYNAHQETARLLASWWERHQEWDRRRVAEEKDLHRRTILRQRALLKLTTEEIEALGIEKRREAEK